MLCAVVEEKEKRDKEVVWAPKEKARLGYFFPGFWGWRETMKTTLGSAGGTGCHGLNQSLGCVNMCSTTSFQPLLGV